jgi:dTDP-4-dehydrorhamnose 3,5-epimerase
MDVTALEIPDVKLIRPRRFVDERGYFEQTWQQNDYLNAGIDAAFVQDNYSYSQRGVLRGLHYQLQNPQAKLVSVVEGAVFDVAVDLRRSSPHFGRWVGCELSASNGHQLFIPRGFAHGFIVLSEHAGFCYKCDNFYVPGDEYAVLWSDPALAIEWPQSIHAVVSEKDGQAPLLKNIAAEHLFE